jgi:hypothetical protein
MVTYPSIEFKSSKEREEFSQISPRLQFILEDMARWVHANGFRFIITDLLSDAYDDIRLGRVSTSHAQGRAADVSIKGWPKDFQKKFELFFESAYSNDGAYSKRTGQINLVEIHDNGNGAHAHIQVRPR